MVFVTGDIHGNPVRLVKEHFPQQAEMTKEDYVIIAGDFGLVWEWKGEDKFERSWLDFLEKECPFTTLFIDGNHENFDRLDALPKMRWHGGYVQEVRPGVLHLLRGQVYDIDGATFFTFGGASSHDIEDGVLEPDDPRIRSYYRHGLSYRVNHCSWWSRELPDEEELEEGRRNLEAHGNAVDFVITHCAPSSLQAMFSEGLYKRDILTDYLEEIHQKIQYRRWYFGHYHEDRAITYRDIMLYSNIVQIL